MTILLIVVVETFASWFFFKKNCCILCVKISSRLAVQCKVSLTDYKFSFIFTSFVILFAKCILTKNIFYKIYYLQHKSEINKYFIF